MFNGKQVLIVNILVGRLGKIMLYKVEPSVAMDVMTNTKASKYKCI